MRRSQLEFRIGFSEIVGGRGPQASNLDPLRLEIKAKFHLDGGGRICGNARNILANLADNYANTVLLYRLIVITLSKRDRGSLGGNIYILVDEFKIDGKRRNLR